MLKFPIYLDNQATTPVDPEVFEFMKPYFTEKFGNASSKSHSFGWEADSAVENARKIITKLFGKHRGSLFFTSGATESINLVHHGIAAMHGSKGKHIITSSVEHSAVLQSLEQLRKHGFEITVLDTDNSGIVDPDMVKKSIKSDTILVSVMTANNEIGTINDISAIADVCKENQVLFHTDSTQAIGKIKFDQFTNLPDLISFTSHKIYGPKGIGALYIADTNPKIKLKPFFYGGGQEKDIRPGTLNVPAIAGFGKAVELCINNFNSENERFKSLRDKLYNGLLNSIADIELNGSIDSRIPNNLNIVFNGVKAEDIILKIREVAVSTGSACSSSDAKSSHVLKSLGLPPEKIRSSVRFGIGRFTTGEEIDYVIEKYSNTINSMKNKISLTTDKTLTN